MWSQGKIGAKNVEWLKKFPSKNQISPRGGKKTNKIVCGLSLCRTTHGTRQFDHQKKVNNVCVEILRTPGIHKRGGEWGEGNSAHESRQKKVPQKTPEPLFFGDMLSPLLVQPGCAWLPELHFHLSCRLAAPPLAGCTPSGLHILQPVDFRFLADAKNPRLHGSSANFPPEADKPTSLGGGGRPHGPQPRSRGRFSKEA